MEIVSVKAEIIKGFTTIVIRQLLAPFNIRPTDIGLVYKTVDLSAGTGIFITANYKKALEFVGLSEFADAFKNSSKMNVDNVYLFDKVHASPKFNKYMFSNAIAINLKKENVFPNQECAELFLRFVNYTNIKYKVGTPQYNYTYPREPILQLKTIENAFSISKLYERYKVLFDQNKKGTALRVPTTLTVPIVREIVPEFTSLHENTVKALIDKFIVYANKEYRTFDALLEYDTIADLKYDLIFYYKNKFMLVS